MSAEMLWHAAKYYGFRVAWVVIFILLLPVSLLWVRTHPFGGEEAPAAPKPAQVPLLQRMKDQA